MLLFLLLNKEDAYSCDLSVISVGKKLPIT